MKINKLQAKALEIIALQMIRIFPLYFVVVNDEEQCNSLKQATVFLFLLHAVLAQMTLLFRTNFSVQQEINHTRQQARFFKSPKLIQEKFDHVYPVAEQSMLWDYTNSHSNQHKYLFRMVFNEENLLNQATLFEKLRNALHQQLTNSKVSNFKNLNVSKVPTVPGRGWNPILQFIIDYIPFHSAAGIDMPTKSRIQAFIDFFLLLLLIPRLRIYLEYLNEFDNFVFSTLLSGLCKDKTPSPREIVFYFILALLEAKLLNEQKRQLALLGIERRITSYFAFPPTCLGQQLTAQYLFVGDNHILRAHAHFLVEMSLYIDELQHRKLGLEYDLSEIKILPECIEANKKLKKMLYIDEREPAWKPSEKRKRVPLKANFDDIYEHSAKIAF